MTETARSLRAAGLVEALVAVSSDLDLPSILDRLVEAACEVTGARYGVLGVVNERREDGAATLSRFVVHGLSAEEIEALGPLPQGHGLLGLLLEDPRPVRVDRLQDHPASVGFPANHPRMERFLGVPVHVRGTVFGNLYLCDRADGEPFTAEDERVVEVLAAGAAHVIENARAYDRSERRRVWLEAVAQINELVQGVGGAEAAARQVAITARRLTRASAAAVVRLSEEAAEPVALDGPRTDFLTVLMPALQRRLDPVVGRDGEVRHVTFGVNELLLLPLREHFGAGGAVVVVSDDAFEPDDVELLTSFADQVALAFDRLNADRQRQELLVVADRERIARDLHDVVIQRLFATGLQLQVLHRITEDAEVLERVAAATDALDTTIRDIRGAIFDLRHAAGPSLRADVGALVAEYAEPLGHRPQVRIEGPVDSVVPRDLADEVAAVLREALSNIARHARARSATVTVAVRGHRLTLTVADDGVGVPPETGRRSGLRNLHERAAARGGTLAVTSPDTGGTRLVWDVPLP
ncbi:MAG: GAF domain-containing sensor histidine kinase [Marmoricola sp.]